MRRETGEDEGTVKKVSTPRILVRDYLKDVCLDTKSQSQGPLGWTRPKLDKFDSMSNS